MNEVLFANSYFYRLDKKQWRFKQPYPPLATVLAAAVIRSKGFNVRLFDANLRQTPTEVIPFLDALPTDFFVLYDDGFNYLSKMCLVDMREAAFALITAAKKAGVKVIVSSSDATDHMEKYFAAGADFIIRGEGEEALSELLVSLRTGKSADGISGVCYLRDGEIISTPPRAVMRDLDTLPIPAWDLVDIESYRRIWLRYHGYFSLNLATTRGCPYKCNWCAKPIYGNRYNSRSPRHVVEEIEYLLEHHHPDHFWMCDDIFGLKPGWISEFSTLVQEKKLKFKYKIQSRVDLLLNDDTIRALAESGAETVWLGAESGSQRILDAMDKGTTVEQIRDARRGLKEHRVRAAFFLQFGYLGETKEDIDKTIQMLLDLMPDEIGISVSYPLPGTKFYDIVKHELTEKQNWTNSDDLAMMFQSTFHHRYYKHLHRYVHSVYQRRKCWMALKELILKPGRLTASHLRSIAGVIYFPARSLWLKRRLEKIEAQNLETNKAVIIPA